LNENGYLVHTRGPGVKITFGKYDRAHLNDIVSDISRILIRLSRCLANTELRTKKLRTTTADQGIGLCYPSNFLLEYSASTLVSTRVHA